MNSSLSVILPQKFIQGPGVDMAWEISSPILKAKIADTLGQLEGQEKIIRVEFQRRFLEDALTAKGGDFEEQILSGIQKLSEALDEGRAKKFREEWEDILDRLKQVAIYLPLELRLTPFFESANIRVFKVSSQIEDGETLKFFANLYDAGLLNPDEAQKLIRDSELLALGEVEIALRTKVQINLSNVPRLQYPDSREPGVLLDRPLSLPKLLTYQTQLPSMRIVVPAAVYERLNSQNRPLDLQVLGTMMPELKHLALNAEEISELVDHHIFSDENLDAIRRALAGDPAAEWPTDREPLPPLQEIRDLLSRHLTAFVQAQTLHMAVRLSKDPNGKFEFRPEFIREDTAPMSLEADDYFVGRASLPLQDIQSLRVDLSNDGRYLQASLTPSQKMSVVLHLDAFRSPHEWFPKTNDRDLEKVYAILSAGEFKLQDLSLRATLEFPNESAYLSIPFHWTDLEFGLDSRGVVVELPCLDGAVCTLGELSVSSLEVNLFGEKPLVTQITEGLPSLIPLGARILGSKKVQQLETVVSAKVQRALESLAISLPMESNEIPLRILSFPLESDAIRCHWEAFGADHKESSKDYLGTLPCVFSLSTLAPRISLSGILTDEVDIESMELEVQRRNPSRRPQALLFFDVLRCGESLCTDIRMPDLRRMLSDLRLKIVKISPIDAKGVTGNMAEGIGIAADLVATAMMGPQLSATQIGALKLSQGVRDLKLGRVQDKIDQIWGEMRGSIADQIKNGIRSFLNGSEAESQDGLLALLMQNLQTEITKLFERPEILALRNDISKIRLPNGIGNLLSLAEIQTAKAIAESLCGCEDALPALPQFLTEDFFASQMVDAKKTVKAKLQELPREHKKEIEQALTDSMMIPSPGEKHSTIEAINQSASDAVAGLLGSYPSFQINQINVPTIDKIRLISKQIHSGQKVYIAEVQTNGNSKIRGERSLQAAASISEESIDDRSIGLLVKESFLHSLLNLNKSLVEEMLTQKIRESEQEGQNGKLVQLRFLHDDFRVGLVPLDHPQHQAPQSAEEIVLQIGMTLFQSGGLVDRMKIIDTNGKDLPVILEIPLRLRFEYENQTFLIVPRDLRILNADAVGKLATFGARKFLEMFQEKIRNMGREGMEEWIELSLSEKIAIPMFRDLKIYPRDLSILRMSVEGEEALLLTIGVDYRGDVESRLHLDFSKDALRSP